MIEAIGTLLRATLAALGLLALVAPDMSGSLVTVAVVALALTLLAVAVVTAGTGSKRNTSADHPTRRAELVAPLAQSDPDAAGHVRRRGPGRVPAAA